MTAGLAPCWYVARAARAPETVVVSDWVNAGVAASALVVRQTPPSNAVVVPLSQTTRVLNVLSLRSNTMSLTLRLPVQGMSKQPCAALPPTLMRVATTEAAGPLAALSL